MNERILRYLEKNGLINAEQAAAIREHLAEGRPLHELLIQYGKLTEDQTLSAVSTVTRIPLVNLYEQSIPLEIRQLVRADMLRQYQILPFAFDPDDPGTLYVAICDPMNIRGRDMVAIATKSKIRTFLTTEEDILVTIDRYYGSSEIQDAVEQFTQVDDTPRSLADEVLLEDINGSPIVVLINTLVEQAIRQRASDIHIEANADRVRIRCRVDGLLYETASYDLAFLSAIVTRVKIMSGMDISEKRKPQDGRFTALVDRREYDVRVSSLPTVFGEKCVLRLAQKTAMSRT